MAAPGCGTCRWFQKMPISAGGGECHDPTKRISYRRGDYIGDAPYVGAEMTCPNWAAKEANDDS